jgi:hypothetical protein
VLVDAAQGAVIRTANYEQDVALTVIRAGCYKRSRLRSGNTMCMSRAFVQRDKTVLPCRKD